jgi:hypothetical protein
VIEQLRPEDVEALSIDPVETGYATVGEPPAAGQKTIRDAASSRSRTSERAGARARQSDPIASLVNSCPTIGASGTAACEYEAYHERSLIDSKGRLSRRRLTRGRRTIRVQVSGRMKDLPQRGRVADHDPAATVTLRRLH